MGHQVGHFWPYSAWVAPVNGVPTSKCDVDINVGFVIVKIIFLEYTGVGKGQWPREWGAWGVVNYCRVLKFQNCLIIIYILLCTVTQKLIHKGHLFLWRQVVPQRTRLNPYEIIGTKYSILGMSVTGIRHLAHVIELIWTLQWVTLNESVIVLTQISPRSCGNHMTKP